MGKILQEKKHTGKNHVYSHSSPLLTFTQLQHIPKKIREDN